MSNPPSVTLYITNINDKVKKEGELQILLLPSSSSSQLKQPAHSLSSALASCCTTELRRNLYALFSVYGKVLDVVHTRSPKTRGTAFIVFRDLASSTSALRGLDGEGFFGKQLVS